MSNEVELLKKTAFMHDLGKILNWSGELHPLDGARVLKHLGFDERIVGGALCHHQRYQDKLQEVEYGGLQSCEEYGEGEYGNYGLKLSQLVDQLMTGFDRLGKAQRIRPIVLRNPLTHLPLNSSMDDPVKDALDDEIHQFRSTRKRSQDDGPDTEYLREFVRKSYLPDATLRRLDDGEKLVYQLDEALASAPMLQALFNNREASFNEFYRTLHTHPDWRALTRHWIPQGHHPPADTLGLWYHMQFSSAVVGLYWAEGFRNTNQIEAEISRLRSQPLEIKIGLLYIHIRGLTKYLTEAYRLPDFSGTQEIAAMLKKTIKQQLMEAKYKSEPFIWEDSFLYEGHDDFLVMVPVERLGEEEENYVYHVGTDDLFLEILREALSTTEIVRLTVESLLTTNKAREILACASDDHKAFGDGEKLRNALENLVSVECATRCFANFKDGSDLRSLFGIVWNRLQAEARGRLRQSETDVRGYAGDICDCCRVNLAGHHPHPDHPRNWAEVDWRRDIIKDETWGERPLHYWVFRGTDEPVPGEGDKLCHACLMRRLLGHGTSLEKIAPKNEEEEARIAVIKGNVNRTLWYIGGSLATTGPLENEDSVYSHVWREEIARPIFERSLAGSGLPDEALERLKKQARCASENCRSGQIDIDTTQEISETLENLWQNYPNPWSPYPLFPEKLDDLIPWFFSGTPHFIKDNEDLPTLSRTMTVSSLISEAVQEVYKVVGTIMDSEARPVVYVGGDEFLIICRAEDAPHLARRIFRRVVAYLNSVPEGRMEALSDFLPVTLAMGMIAAKRKHPMYGILELVDRLVYNAKTAYPNRNAIDFENVVGGVDELYLNREAFTEKWLSKRPLTQAQFAWLLDQLSELREKSFPGRQLQQVAALTDSIPGTRVDRTVATLAYAWQPHEGEGWDIVRNNCEKGTFQDLTTLWRWPQRKEENENA
jgi:hypothetical protein